MTRRHCAPSPWTCLPLGKLRGSVRTEVANALDGATAVAIQDQMLVEDRCSKRLRALHNVLVVANGVPAKAGFRPSIAKQACAVIRSGTGGEYRADNCRKLICMLEACTRFEASSPLATTASFRLTEHASALFRVFTVNYCINLSVSTKGGMNAPPENNCETDLQCMVHTQFRPPREHEKK